MESHDVEYWAGSCCFISFLNGHFIHPVSSAFFQQKGVKNEGDNDEKTRNVLKTC